MIYVIACSSNSQKSSSSKISQYCSMDFLLTVLIICLLIGFVVYVILVVGLSIYLIYWIAPQYGQTNILVYILICSLIGSLTVVACKGLSIAIKLTLEGKSQLSNPLSWLFLVAMVMCITVQMNYLNKSLDTFNTSMVTPIYYVMFTTLTIVASGLLFKEWNQLTHVGIIGEICGFATIICGVFLLHAFKDINVRFRDLVALTNRTNRTNSTSLNNDAQTEEIPAVVSQRKEFNLSHSPTHPNDSEEERNISEGDTFIRQNSRTT